MSAIPRSAEDGMPAALTVICLDVAYWSSTGWTPAVEDVSFTIGDGEALGLAGESGCGKSTIAYTLMGERRPGSRIRDGRVLLDGEDLLALTERQLQPLRGTRISLVPQTPPPVSRPP